MSHDGMGELAYAAFGTVMVCTIFGSWFLILWLGYFRPNRLARAEHARLESALGLTPMSHDQSVFPMVRDAFAWGVVPMSRGSRGEFHVEVYVRFGARKVASPTTSVIVSGPRSLGAKLLVSRRPEYLTFSATALNPFAKSPYERPTGPLDLRSFLGPAITLYDTGELPRLLDERVRAEIQAFPHIWLDLMFDGPSMLLSWWGTDQDPMVIEQAFLVVATCLQNLAPAPTN